MSNSFVVSFFVLMNEGEDKKNKTKESESS